MKHGPIISIDRVHGYSKGEDIISQTYVLKNVLCLEIIYLFYMHL